MADRAALGRGGEMPVLRQRLAQRLVGGRAGLDEFQDARGLVEHGGGHLCPMKYTEYSGKGKTLSRGNLGLSES